ncbi:MAG: transcriptional repressor [Treponema sp.]|nr:transcriptional repressor [Treponema sp.]
MQNRNSAQRNLILDIMDGNKSHPTADQIYDEARKVDPHISRGTVYRNLNLLVDNGNLLRISVPDGADHFDSTLVQHYHFYCRKCNKVYDVPEFCPSQVIETEKKLGKLGFQSVNHNIVFDGICPDCCKENH